MYICVVALETVARGQVAAILSKFENTLNSPSDMILVQAFKFLINKLNRPTNATLPFQYEHVHVVCDIFQLF